LYVLSGAPAEALRSSNRGGSGGIKSELRVAELLRDVYQRAPLILDSDGRCLAKVSQSLVVLGHQPLYSEDLDELIALARECPAQAGALLLPAAHARDWWPAVHKDLAEPIGLSPRSVLPVGERLADADAQALHEQGLRWALSEPFTPWELRFAVTMALSASDPNELRLEMRVPCSFAVEVRSQSRTVPARITDLSTTGAFVELAHPPAEGAMIVLAGELSGRTIALSARVAWRTGPGSASWRDRGIGVQFERVELAVLDLLRQQMVRALDRFRLR
jgi:hypothetical protein